MGCFFTCFRVRDDRRPQIHLLSQPIVSNPKDHVESVARNRLSSLLLFEADDRDQSPCKDGKCGVLGSGSSDFNSNELKAEAKFLKACGTLPQTPTEIRNNNKPKDSEPQNEDTESSKFHSWLQTSSLEKLKPDNQSTQHPSLTKIFQEWDNKSDSSSHSLDSCVTGQANQAQTPTDSSTQITNTKFTNKSVRFDCEIDASSFSSSSSSSEVTSQFPPNPSVTPGDYSVLKPSPYPTPLTLPNDMQTPGTVFHASFHNKEIGKNPRIRSQFVIPVLSPVENANQLKKLVEESLSSDNEISENVDTSLSSWLPPKQKHVGGGFPKVGKTPGDRPILGMVAAHWNADEAAASFPPKWWDGNGIPNSTHKYNEDQKVSWHATPFEERLEKALSEDKLTAERKQIGKVPLVDLDEKDECESTGRTLASSSHFESGYVLINSS